MIGENGHKHNIMFKFWTMLTEFKKWFGGHDYLCLCYFIKNIHFIRYLTNKIWLETTVDEVQIQKT